MSGYPCERRLDGVFFRVNRAGSHRSICFSDLTKEERWQVLEDRSSKWLKRLCVILGQCIQDMGDDFGIVATYLYDTEDEVPADPLERIWQEYVM